MATTIYVLTSLGAAYVLAATQIYGNQTTSSSLYTLETVRVKVQAVEDAVIAIDCEAVTVNFLDSSQV